MSFFSNRKQADVEIEREEKQVVKPAIPQHPIGFDTVLGATSKLEGSLHSEGNVRLDGEFSGTLEIKGNVLVGETAKINADIEARNISIAGAVRGNVTGNKVQLLRTGRIWGDITANALTTEEGAFIDGKITMKGHSASPSEPLAMVEASKAEVILQAPIEAVSSDLPKTDEETQERELDELKLDENDESND